MEAHLYMVHDCEGHRRDTTWYLKEPNKNYIHLEGYPD